MYPAFAKPLAVVLLLMFSRTLCLRTEQITFHEEYCHGSVEETGYQGLISSSRNDSESFLAIHGAFFTGGAPFFNGNATLFSFRNPEKSVFLAIHNTTTPSTEQGRPRILVDASLLVRNRSLVWFPDSFRDSRHAQARRDPFQRAGGVRFTLKGVWSPHSGILCMAGCVIQDNRPQSTGSDCKVKAFFRYPLVNNIRQPLVKGTVQSMRDMSDPLFFRPMFMTARYAAPFVFTEDDETGAIVDANVPPHVKVWKADSAVCEFPWFKQPLTITWDKQCTGQDCSPFKAVGPTTISTLAVENEICSGGKVHGFFIFSNAPSMPERWYSTMYDVSGIEGVWNDVLAFEGVWNSTTGQLSALGCYLEGITNRSLEFTSKDCDIVITLQFPITLELTFRYSIVGRIARMAGSTLTPFKPFLFTGHLDMSYGPFGWSTSPPQLEYVYTAEKIMHATSECQSGSPGQSIQSKLGKKNLTYPDGQNFRDLAFLAIFKVSSASEILSAQFSPVSINERTNMDRNPSWDDVVSTSTSHEKGSLKISFEINFYGLWPDVKLMNNTSSSQLPAEGVYDPNTGLLCLIACRSFSVSKAQGMSKVYDGEKDCEMHITVHFPPANPGYFDKQHVSGQIRSLRDKKDALFFSPIDITSNQLFYQAGAEQFLRQIDLEIVVGVISLTMAFLFIGLQLHHVKKYPKVLPQISLLMLFILILAHLIPLLLNFEAVFMKAYPQNVLSWSGGWLEINEALVRLMTMVVFLMLVRLLYLSWVSKTAVEGCWNMEKKLLRVCLITYGLAGLITMIIYSVKGSNFLDLVKVFSGLTVDFFLFPQVIGNYVWEIHDRILSCPFYIGMTFVRIVPYVHDIVRKFDFFWIIHRRPLYLDPKWDTYSNAWNVMIPCGGLLLAILVFCQQRYGGTFFSPASWRQRRVYTQISMSPI